MVAKPASISGFIAQLCAGLMVKWSQKTGHLAKVYPKPMKGYENGEAPEFYRSV